MLINNARIALSFYGKYIWLLFIPLLFACQPNETPTPPPPTTSSTNSLPFISLEQNNGITDTSQYSLEEDGKPVIFPIIQLTDINLIRTSFGPDLKEKLEAINYQTSFALVVFQGLAGSAQNRVEVTQVTQNGKALHIEAVFHVPAPGAGVEDVVAYPYQVIHIQAPYDPEQMQVIYLFVDGKIVASYPTDPANLASTTEATPLPETDLELPQFAREIALNYVANDLQVDKSLITIEYEEALTFPALDRRFARFTIVYNLEQKFEVYKLLVDLEDGHVEEDIGVLRQAEAQANEAIYGKLEPILYDRLQTATETELIPVAIWIKAPEGQSLGELQYTIYLEIAEKYPEAKESLENGGKPTDVSDSQLAQEINDYYNQRLDEMIDSRVTPLVQTLQNEGFTAMTYQGMPSFTTHLPKWKILQLNESAEVSRIYLIEAEPVLELDSAIPNSLAPAVWSKGIKGTGTTIGILEWGNVDTNNSYLHHATTALTSDGGVQNHPTLVASSAASFHDTYSGMAPGATILSAASFTPEADMVYALTWAAKEQDAPIINFSGGYNYPEDNVLHWLDRAFDYWAVRSNSFIVKSSGTLSISPMLTSPGRAWNVFVVGAYNDFNNTNWEDDVIYPFSVYQNPCVISDDCQGREKPEVVASGANIDSIGVDNLLNLGISGTSLVAPQVAGLAALLIDREPLLEE